MPSSKERPLLPLHPGLKDLKVCVQFCLVYGWPWQNLCGNVILFFIFLQGPQCLKVLTYTGWNPPPGNRRMHGKKHVSFILTGFCRFKFQYKEDRTQIWISFLGDLLYLYVLTLEDKKYHITASTRGFYVNQWVLTWCMSKINKSLERFLHQVFLFAGMFHSCRFLDFVLDQRKMNLIQELLSKSFYLTPL